MDKISIFKEEDRLTVAAILVKNKYAVRQGVDKKGKAYTYYLEYWPADQQFDTPMDSSKGRLLDHSAILEIQSIYVKGSSTYGVKPLSRRYGVSESAIEHALKVKLPANGGDNDDG